MVRATVGTLIDVGLSKIEPSEIENILQKKNRGEAKTSVPGHALFLWEVKYPIEFEIKI
jgi:tRNA pseudouridine38-40 synthase